jgi:3D (Asp-Asp-Asp) domain-containing protein
MRKCACKGFAALFFSLLFSSCGSDGVNTQFAQGNSPNGSPELRIYPLPGVSARLRNTHYYTLFESDYNDPVSAPILNPSGAKIATVSPRFKKDLLMEGSGKLKDGRVLNYATSVGGIHRYVVSPNAWGNGVGKCALVPFHTVAVDRRIVPLGSIVYIDETKGMPLPDGTLHDGVWRAEDIGSAIQNDRVDLYIGKRGWNTTLSRYKIKHLQALTVRILALPDGESCAY